MNLGQYIKQLRLNKNMTQEEVGEFVGVQRAAVQKWECGKTQNIKRPTLQKLAELFNVPASSFIAEIIAVKENPTTVSDDGLSGLDKELISSLCQLSPEQALRVRDFVQGLLASR